MPLILEEESRFGGAGLDLLNITTLFWKSIPVIFKQPDREDVVEDLNFRILSGYSRTNHSSRILRIYISNDNDLFFLHSLEVSEEEFQTLKTEQGILVDFSNFPGKIITLLDKCLVVQAPDASRFQAVVTVRGTESLFKIVEINDFKQLAHITLAFRPGNDSTVKQFLAFRLLEVKNNCSDVSDQLKSCTDAHQNAMSQLSETKSQMKSLKEQLDSVTLEARTSVVTQQAVAQEERLKELQNVKDQFERDKTDMERKLKDQIETLRSRNAEMDVENRKLRDAKYELDSKVSELSHKLGTTEGGQRSAEQENTKFRSQIVQLSNDVHERDIQLNDVKGRLIAAEEKVQAQQEMIQQQKLRMSDLEAAAKQSEARCSDLRASLTSCEERVKEAAAEISKGNQIIEKLSNDLRISKDKLKRRQAILVRQEEELQQRETALGAASRDTSQLQHALERVKEEQEMLRSENEALRAKLEDSKQQLQSNEQMIRWLNQQVTEAQVGASGSLGSRYTFKPSLTAATSSAGSGVPLLTGGMGTKTGLSSGASGVLPKTYGSLGLSQSMGSDALAYGKVGVSR